MGVAHVLRDQPVAVHCDHDDVQNGRRATEDVRRNPEITDVRPQRPRAYDLVVQTDGKDNDGDQQVSTGQGHNQAVGQRAHVPKQRHGQDDKHVAHNYC